MYYKFLDQELVGTIVGYTLQRRLPFYSPGGGTFLREMTSRPPSWNYGVKSKIRLRQSIHVYVGNNKHSCQISSRSD